MKSHATPMIQLNSDGPFRPTPETAREIYLTQIIVLALICLTAVWLRGPRLLVNLALASGVSLLWTLARNRCRNTDTPIPDGYLYAAQAGGLLACLAPLSTPWYALAGAVVAGQLISALSGLGLRTGRISAAALGAGLLAWFSFESTPPDPLSPLRHLAGLSWDGPVPQLDLLLAGNLPELDTLIFNNPHVTPALACPAVLILGGMYFIYRGYVSPHAPFWMSLAFLAAAALLPVPTSAGPVVTVPLLAQGLDVGLVWLANHYFTGTVVFVAFIMSTDSLTRPVTPRGQALWALLTGTAMVLLRYYTSIPAPDLAALCLTQLATPAIDRVTRPR